MANPLSSAAAYRNAKTVMVKEIHCGRDKILADETAKGLRESGAHHRVVVRSYKIGPRRNPITQFVVRCYDK